MLAVIFLPVILLSVGADAQPTVDETTQCDSNTLEEVATEIKKDIRDEITGVKELIVSGNKENSEARNETTLEEVGKNINHVKTLLASGCRETNDTGLEDVANMIKVIASNQQQNAQEIRDMKRLLVSERLESNETTRLEEVANDIKEDIKDEIRGVKEMIESGNGQTSEGRNETTLEELGKDIKEHVDIVLYLINDEIADVKTLLAPGSRETNDTSLDQDLSLIHI